MKKEEIKKKLAKKKERGKQRIQRRDIEDGGGYPSSSAFWFWAEKKESNFGFS